MILQDRIKEVQCALRKAGLPLGAKSAEPMTLEDYEFKKDPKDFTVYWDVRKVQKPFSAHQAQRITQYHHP